MFATLRLAAVALALSAGLASAQTVSPAGGALPGTVSKVGGIVLDLIGLNGNRVVSQLAASTLYVGFAGENPQPIGTQTGFTASVLAALGGGLSELAARVTLFDGDSAAGDFDGGADNTFLVNGTGIGLFSAVATTLTDSLGNAQGPVGSRLGFANQELDTGFFFTDDALTLASIFASLTATGTAVYGVDDVDPFDNFYDFTIGIDADLIDVGTGPVVTPVSPVPLPASLPLLAAAFGALGVARMRRRA